MTSESTSRNGERSRKVQRFLAVALAAASVWAVAETAFATGDGAPPTTAPSASSGEPTSVEIPESTEVTVDSTEIPESTEVPVESTEVPESTEVTVVSTEVPQSTEIIADSTDHAVDSTPEAVDPLGADQAVATLQVPTLFSASIAAPAAQSTPLVASAPAVPAAQSLTLAVSAPAPSASPASPAVLAAPNTSVPLNAGGLRSSVGASRMTVAWNAPVANGSAPVLSYRVQLATSTRGPWLTLKWTTASTRGVIFTGLRNGTQYYARVIAVNRYGAGRPSWYTSNVPVAPRAPGAPGGLRSSVGSGRVTVAWNTPSNNGGAPVLSYRVQLATTSAGPWVTLKWTPASTHGVIFTGLRNGSRYYARVIAVNAGGASAPSAPVSAVPAGPRAPGAPGGLRTSVGSGRVTVAWNAPSYSGGAPVLSYRVQLATTASGPWVTLRWTPAGTHGVIFTGLRNGTRYYARVIANNAGGVGTPSAPVSAVPQGLVLAASVPATGCSSSANTPGGSDGRGGCFPGPDNTGPNRPASQMATYTGPCTITAPNTVIDSRVIRCDISVRAGGLVIRNSYIYGAVVSPEGASFGFRIEDSFMDGGVCVDCGVAGANFTILRSEVTGGNRGAYCARNCTIQDSYFHGTALDPNSEAHASAVRVEQDARLIHNSLACDWVGPFNNNEIGCSADMTGYPDFAPIKNNMIDGNLFVANPVGLGFCAYGGGTNGKPYSNDPTNATNIVFRNNVFQRGANGKCGAYGPVTDFDTTGNSWFNNLWDDGTPVPPG